MKKMAVVIALAIVGVPGALNAQQIKVSNTTLLVGQEVAIQLDRAPERNESITWMIQSGEGQWVGDVTQQRVTFRAAKPGEIIIICVINAPGQPERRPSTNLTVTGSAQPTPPPATPPPPTPPPVSKSPSAGQPARPQVPVAQANRPSTLALEDIDQVVPAGWMGDAMSENSGTALLDPGHTTGCHSRPSCYRVEYKPGKVGWAAFAWQRVPEGSMNWGEYPGVDLNRRADGTSFGFQSLRLWARGDLSASGGTPPKAQFKSGGNVAPNFSKTNPASYSVAGPTVELTDWKEYCLDLRGKDLTNIVSPLTVVVTRASNPKNAVIVIDDVVFSTSVCTR